MSQNNEFLLNNALAEDFQQMLRPYYWTQKLLFASKYSIKDNFVLPNSRTYCAVNVLVLCFIIYAYFAVSLETSCTMGNQCPLITDMHNLVAHFIATACVIVQTKSAVKLLIMMQSLDRKLKTFGVPKLPYFVMRNWCSTILLLLLFGFGILVTTLNTDRFPWLTYVTVVLTMIFDLDVLYSTCVLEFISSRLECFSNLFFDYVRDPPNESVENNSSDTFTVLFKISKIILKAFTLSGKLAQYPVLSYIVATFVNILVTLQIVIGWTKSEKTNGIYEHISIIHVLSVAWNTKNFLIIVMFSTSCEKFYSSIDGLKHNCVVVLNSTPEKSVSRNVTKNVLRLCDVRFSKMRVCGWFTADAALPLRLMSLVATYCIVLLQFAFL